MQEQLSKDRLNLFYRVIINREFAALKEIEEYYQPFYLDLKTEEYFHPLEKIFLYYIYYVMLTPEDRKIFPYLKGVITASNNELSLIYRTKNMLYVYENTKWEDEDIEQKILFLGAAKILQYYDKDAGFINKDNENLDFEVLFKSLYANNYCKYTDAILCIYLIGYGTINIEDKFDKGICDKVDTILFSVVEMALMKRLFKEYNEEDNKEIPSNELIEQMADEMILI